MSLSLGQYSRFMFVGGIVGVITIGCRELFGLILGPDTPVAYSISIAGAYGVGITLSFLLNHRFTFSRSGTTRSWRRFGRFFAVAVTGLLATWILSLALRYGIRLDALIGPPAKVVAFATATLLSSALTYPLNSLFVFREPRLAAGPASGGST